MIIIVVIFFFFFRGTCRGAADVVTDMRCSIRFLVLFWVVQRSWNFVVLDFNPPIKRKAATIVGVRRKKSHIMEKGRVIIVRVQQSKCNIFTSTTHMSKKQVFKCYKPTSTTNDPSHFKE